MKKWLTYLGERFPVPVTAALGFATAAGALGRVGTWATARGGLLMFLLLFHLRVFDEHKDAEHDAATRPDRPVQRGLVTLRELAIAGGVAIALEAALGGWWWLAPLGYSVLMLVEFGVPRWLARHYTVYAISHSAITAVVCVALVGGMPPVALLVMALASTFSIDVLRKIVPHETPGVDSWSGRLGIRRACMLGAALLVIAGACAAALSTIWFPALVTLACVTAIARFQKQPKMLQLICGLHYLAVWIGVAVIR